MNTVSVLIERYLPVLRCQEIDPFQLLTLVTQGAARGGLAWQNNIVGVVLWPFM